MAELKVEATNFAQFDYYEPCEFNLIAKEGFTSYEFQLKIMFQLVKPTSQFVVPGRADTSNLPPVAYNIEISSASLNVLKPKGSDG